MRILQRSLKNVKLESEISIKFFFIKIFLIVYCNVNTFRIIHNTSKTFIVVSKAVNDTSRSAHIIKIGWHSHRILYTHSIENCLNLSIFEVVEIQHICVYSWYRNKVMPPDLILQDFPKRPVFYSFCPPRVLFISFDSIRS